MDDTVIASAGAAWTIDASSGKACPEDANEWSAFMSSLGMGSKVPSHVWGCQDAASPLTDSIGGSPMASWGTPSLTYQQSSPGWSRVAAYNPAAGGGWSTNTAVDPSATSVAMLVYARIASASSNRTICYINMGTGANVDTIAAFVYGTIGMKAMCDGVETLNSVSHHDDTVHPWLLVYNRTAGTCTLYTDKGVVSTTYTADIVPNAMGLARGGQWSSPNAYFLYACAWEGAAAEFTPSEARALIDGLGFPTSGWSKDATSGWALPANADEWTALLAGTSISNPSLLWLCQESSGNLADSIGSNVGVATASLSYLQNVSGWFRKAISIQDGSVRNITCTSVPNIATESCLVLAMILYPSIAATTARSVITLGTIFGNEAACNIQRGASSVLLGVGGGNGTIGDPRTVLGTSSPFGAVHPTILQVNRANSSVVIQTDEETLAPPWSSSFTGAKLWLGGDNINTWLAGGTGYLYVAAWFGAAAEMSAGQRAELLNRIQSGA